MCGAISPLPHTSSWHSAQLGTDHTLYLTIATRKSKKSLKVRSWSTSIFQMRYFRFPFLFGLHVNSRSNTEIYTLVLQSQTLHNTHVGFLFIGTFQHVQNVSYKSWYVLMFRVMRLLFLCVKTDKL
jgi:hypothetical protein